MNVIPKSLKKKRGSALLTVVMLTAMMAILTGSMLTYTMSERRGNERNRLILRAKNMAENITIYAAEQLSTKLYRLGSAPVGAFPWTGTSRNRVFMPPDQVLDTGFTTHTTAEMRAAIQTASSYVLETDTSSPNYGLQVSTALVPIIAKATATLPALGSVTAYVEQDMSLALTPLFQFGMFYNMDLELYPSQDFTLAGPVHTNGRLLAHPDGGATTNITFTDRVTSASSLFADANIKTITRGGSGAETTATPSNGQVYFTHTDGVTQASLKNNASATSGLWRDHKYLTTSETTSTIANFKTFATTTYNGNLRTSAHGVTKLELPGIGTYKEVDDPSTPLVDERSNGREIIEPPNAKKWVWNTSTTTGAWTANTDDPDAKETKLSWKCGLYIIVNPGGPVSAAAPSRSCTLPDGTTTFLMPYSYRAFLNTINTSTGVHAVSEVILPGQPTYGYNLGADGTANTGDDFMYRNYMPNRYDTNNSVAGNQVLRMPQTLFGTATGYQINNAAGYAIGATALIVDTGSGPIPVGDTVTIGAFKYLVTGALTGGTVTIASPGLRAAIIDDAAVTVDQATNIPGTGYDYAINSGGGYAIGATALIVDTGTGTILPGNIITIGAKKYKVSTATPAAGPVTSITIPSPGLTAAVLNNDPVTVDSMSGTVGSGTGYLTNGARVAADNFFVVDTGTGTILPGNTISTVVSGNTYRYVVSSALSNAAGTVRVNFAQNLGVAVPDNNAITVDAASYDVNPAGTGTGATYEINLGAGYAAGQTSLVVDTGTSLIRPGNIIGIGFNQYVVTAVSPAAPPHTSITIASPGLLAAAADNAVVMLDPTMVNGYDRSSGSGNIFPADSATYPYPAEAYFFDMRRATSNRGVISLSGTQALYDRFTVPYEPRAVAKIDFDLTRFKMFVDRVISAATTSTVYDPRAPNIATGLAMDFTKSIFNTAAATTAFGLGLGATYNTFPSAGSVATLTMQDPFQLYYVPVNPVDPVIFTNPLSFAVPSTALYSSSTYSAWYDGIAIYLHSVDAEIRKQTNGVPDRPDSGVRFVNGRGPVASLTPVGKTGFTFVTNDACYIIGHFNADGTINSTVTASGNGGFSARYPDSASEKLCAIMGDAITIMAAPTWTNTGSGQVTGWNDAYSALPASASTAGWRTGASTTATLAGGQDGVTITTAINPGRLPTSSTPYTTVGTADTVKLDGIDTEVSTALLMGVIPTNHRAKELTDGFVQTWSHSATGDPSIIGNRVNAGGANNFPRLLDNWQPGGVRKGLYIRGSIIGMYESRVAMEPFTNSRCYLAPGRFWGLHQNFRTVNHDVPLEPIVLNSTRIGFRELTPTEYSSLKTTIEALTVIP